MEASARRVRAQRDRRRLPARKPVNRWARRILGVLATAAFLGFGIGAALKVMPDRDNGAGAAAVTAPTATPARHKAKKHAKHKAKAKKPKGPTKAQLAARASAVDELRRQGYTTLKPSDYDPKATFRVLIGRPVGDAGGGQFAFFFMRGQYLGHDAAAPSSRLRLVTRGDSALTLAYGVYNPGDTPGVPSGSAKVRFQLEGGRIHSLDAIPDAGARFERRST
jgi:LppP/LprE lipoprotein